MKWRRPITPDPAKGMLLYALSEISEEAYCASWYDGMEFIVWAALKNDLPLDWCRAQDGDFGWPPPDAPEYVGMLHRAEAIGAWPMWADDEPATSDGTGEPYHVKWVPLAEWTPIYEQWKSQHIAREDGQKGSD